MCNCKTSICDSCNSGFNCQCPPDYSVMPLPVPCNCCPPGFTYNNSSSSTSARYPNGYCTGQGKTIDPIQCVSCEQAISTDCVTYTQLESVCQPSGIQKGDSLTVILAKICITNKPNIKALLSAIGNDIELLSGFCNLVQACGISPGNSTPQIGPISWTIP